MFLIDILTWMHWDIVAAVSAVVLVLGGSIIMRWYLYRADKQAIENKENLDNGKE